MGFMDKAKKLADQAQQKLDEVQQQMNEKQGSTGQAPAGAPPVEYDQHGRPVARDQETPQGDPLAGSHAPPPPADKGPAVQPEPAGDPEPPHGDPLRDAPKAPAPPSGGQGMTGGDPLAG